MPFVAQQREVKLPPEATEFYELVPRRVTPAAQNHLPPSDAIVLFDGNNSTILSVRSGGFHGKLKTVLLQLPKNRGYSNQTRF